ncbi:DUF732 domain-containing protein [Mycobacterium sp. M1]|uniref:DUF732 domain-containing protein n=1 Tax=Mycolicibacter acidiphilus TaxID=2835306 RepID=A0ABS5RE71_9MYCO|nr:DUF732 domain-containing protein [Mycolicibacter acidiphilus]MBS9532578.1 DUF732 domain-containing protein [Mycolicibacter acidiphilus]
MMRRTMAALALAVGLLPIAPGVAHADDAGYLRILHNLGKCDTDRCNLKIDDQDALNLGRTACQGMTSGMSDGDVDSTIMQTSPMSLRDADTVRLAAKMELCRKH